MAELKIFIVEDDSWYAEILEYHLKLNPDYEVETYGTGKDCLRELYKNPDVITLDYNLPDMKGKEILKTIKKSNPDIEVIMISGQEDINTAIELLKEGAYDYIVKDEEAKDRLWNSLRHLKETASLKKENRMLKKEISKKYQFENIIKGQSKAIKKVFEMMTKAIDNNITVSITGETGTGKELVAKAIHHNSLRSKNPFVAVNVGAIPKDLVESELFGHEKGAFTGAHSQRKGKFEEAHKGTIFLDEIAEMDMEMQTKLLRVLQEREVVRVGSNKPVKTDVRVIIATHQNLGELVKQGRFRQDLYYRLIGLPIHIPPLRERDSDIILLAKFFADDFARENQKNAPDVSEQARKKLLKYRYPGNVRELKAVMDLAVVMAGNSHIEPSHIIFNEVDPLGDFLAQETSLEVYNLKIVKYYLEKYDGNAILVAKKLQVGKSTIYRMIKKYNL